MRLVVFISFVVLCLSFSVSINARKLVPAMYVFGDSIVDVGNNNYLKFSTLKANFPHNGIDFPGKKPTGRYSNGKSVADFHAKKVGLATSPPYPSLVSKGKAFPITGVSFASGGAGIINATNKDPDKLILRGIHKVPEKYVLRRRGKKVKRAHTKVRISYDKSAKSIEARRNDNVCNLYKEIANLVEDNEEKYDILMAKGHEFKRQLLETQVVCASNIVDDTVNSFSFGDGVIPSKQSTNILDPERVTRKGRPPCKMKQSLVKKAVKKKREAVKKRSFTAEKAAVSNQQVKEIGDIAVLNVATTQETLANVNNYANMGPLMWPNMGPLMWPNMMPHCFQIPPNLMPTMQSAIRGGPQGWGRPQSSLMGSQLQECQVVQPSFVEMMKGMNNEKE